MLLKPEHLKAIFPSLREPQGWILPLEQALTKFGITRPDVIAVFLAHVGVESQELSKLEESLRYTAARLCEVWPSRFPNIQVAQQYANNPKALGNHVYGGRLGNTEPNDGWTFRGRGLIQITGRANYAAFSAAMGNDRLAGKGQLLLQPGIIATKRYAALSAAWFWASRPQLTELAVDSPGDNNSADFRSITKIVTGGHQGIYQRYVYWERAKLALGVSNAESRLADNGGSNAGQVHSPTNPKTQSPESGQESGQGRQAITA